MIPRQNKYFDISDASNYNRDVAIAPNVRHFRSPQTKRSHLVKYSRRVVSQIQPRIN